MNRLLDWWFSLWYGSHRDTDTTWHAHAQRGVCNICGRAFRSWDRMIAHGR